MNTETMTSRERVIRTLNHEPVDRVPIDFGSHFSTGISAFAYWELREHLGLSTDNIRIADPVQFLARIDDDILERFHSDCILLQPPWPETMRWNPRGKYEFTIPASMSPQKNDKGEWVVEKTYSDREAQRMRMPEGGFFFDGSWMGAGYWHNKSGDEWFAASAREAECIYKETSYATNYMGLGSFFGGIEHGIRMQLEPDAVLEANERACENSINSFRKVNDAMGKYIQLVTVGNDMGTQKGPICNPEDVERFCGPFYKRFCDFVHENSDIKVYMHNCGSIKPLIPMFIEWGIDALNPVQISADNMDPRELKEEFGDGITFWGGGCDTQNVLGVKTPEGVAQNVRELVSIFKPGGGFVFNQVHNILGNVPPENVVAMFDTAYSNSFY
ncbi:uroporphyrinogen decarboxylase family protein [Candidatus Poribacteria bacterium]